MSANAACVQDDIGGRARLRSDMMSDDDGEEEEATNERRV